MSCLGIRAAGLRLPRARAAGHRVQHRQQLRNAASSVVAANGTRRPNPPGVAGNGVIGVRRETKNRWERRAPVTPSHVRTLRRHGVEVLVQPSPLRFFTDEQYRAAGAVVCEDISAASVIVGVKEVPIEELIPNRTYLCFSHTIKAQPANMALLDAVQSLNVRLIDYECMTDAQGKRLIGFGQFAGNAGMIDLLRGLGDRLLGLGYSNPFLAMGYSDFYHSLSAARSALHLVGHNIQIDGVPKPVAPAIFAFTGSGNVALGAYDIFEELPFEWIEPSELQDAVSMGETRVLYGLKLSREDIVQHKLPSVQQAGFDAVHYAQHPEEYEGIFHKNIAPHITALVNGMYWEQKFPRLLSNAQMEELHRSGNSRLLAIADISADPHGSIEFSNDKTKVNQPFLVHHPVTGEDVFDWEAEGILIGAVDNLPAELPKEASVHFGNKLVRYLVQLAHDEIDDGTKQMLQDATITRDGALTSRFAYIKDLREQQETAARASQKRVLLLGSGNVAGPVVERLTSANADRHPVHLTVASNDLDGARRLAAMAPDHAIAVNLDVSDATSLEGLVASHDVVISLLPYTLHTAIAEMCIQQQTDLVTTSYQTPAMEALCEKAAAAGVTILNEVGLDPGLDHLEALRVVRDVHARGGEIEAFTSWCGGLPDPTVSGNALGYKFSWSPRGVLLAGLNGAKYTKDGGQIEITPGTLLQQCKPIDIMPGFSFEGYPNRDSTLYADIYSIPHASTVLRGTLRYQGFGQVMQGIEALGLLSTQEVPYLNVDAPPITWAEAFSQLVGTRSEAERLLTDQFDASVAHKVIHALGSLGVLSGEPVAMAGTPLDALCHLLQERLAYAPGEQDLVVLRHTFDVKWPLGQRERIVSTLTKSDPVSEMSAMAKTVGYPCAAATEYLLSGRFAEDNPGGVFRPTDPALGEYILKEMQAYGIRFNVESQPLEV